MHDYRLNRHGFYAIARFAPWLKVNCCPFDLAVTPGMLPNIYLSYFLPQ